MDDEQINQLKQIFSRFDSDNDGSLTLPELAGLLRSLGLKPPGDHLQTLLNATDANGNGAIEFGEFFHLVLPAMNEQVKMNQAQLIEVFKMFDRDGNGFITAAELAGAMAKMGEPLTFTELRGMMGEADADADGAIDFNEFASIMARSAHDFLGIDLTRQ